ncbi:hypothetical protein BP5796_05570 [Coleophoma crateriformis]|uniref:RING-type domain-containing protein n=1 Tax=Coleophoma crateriformis TaxID=565419 RepID=A0A3D8S3K3_9HELO|nr:hypothetical protein BP5796_05570 [Coleophoma crateriformis]
MFRAQRQPFRWQPGHEVIDLDNEAEVDGSPAREVIDLGLDSEEDGIAPKNNDILNRINLGGRARKDEIVLDDSDLEDFYSPADPQTRQPAAVKQQLVQDREDGGLDDFILDQSRSDSLEKGDDDDSVYFDLELGQSERGFHAALASNGSIEAEDNASLQDMLAQTKGKSIPAVPREQQEVISPKVQTKAACIDTVAAMFPGICLNYAEGIFHSISHDSEQLIAHILDQAENGEKWPKAKDMQKLLKRKREVNEEDEAIRKYTTERQLADPMHDMKILIKECLQEDFVSTPMTYIEAVLKQDNYRLFPAYIVLELAERTWDSRNPTYLKLKKNRKVRNAYLDKSNPQLLDAHLENDHLEIQTREILLEFQAARKLRRKQDQAREAERQLVAAEEQNLLEAQREGLMSECGCCFCDHPINRMVYCDKDEGHMFCRGCARQMAETEIGNSKKLFLDEKSTIALERNEQEAALRMAGIENLASCPFCPYAAEYPPVEVNREFTCAAPDCERVSCRLCRMDSHIPKTCAENAKENSLSIRRQIEEAMSAALIRRCNKCSTPFVKENGCNKMTCTRAGCSNTQCYVCSKPAGYDHFNDLTRGGKVGNCPLFDTQDLLLEQRHENEIRQAEKVALAKIRADHPEYTEDDLKINMSEKVAEDDKRRRAEHDPRARVLANIVAGRLDRYHRRHLNQGLAQPQNPQQPGDAVDLRLFNAMVLARAEDLNIRQAPIRPGGPDNIRQAIAVDRGVHPRLLRGGNAAIQQGEVQAQAPRAYALGAAAVPPQPELLLDRGRGIPGYGMDDFRDMHFMLGGPLRQGLARLEAGDRGDAQVQNLLQGDWL